MPDESVNCVITSPPYWGLRDYGVVGQIGMEPTLSEHLTVMVDVFREVRRVLRKDGTCWVNYGDCYATSPNGRSAADTKAAGNDDRTFRDKPFSTIQGTMKPKDLCMIPNRLAIALQDDGWWVRSEIIWHKPNPMPESIKDRPACSHEKIWLLSKSERYFYDHEAVRRPMADASLSRLEQDTENQTGSFRQPGKTNGPMKTVGRVAYQRGHSRRHAGFNDRWDAMPKDEQCASANLRNVWTIATAAFSEAHFATFPPALVEPCVKAGTSEVGICPKCLAPWNRLTTSEFIPQQDVSEARGVRGATGQKPMDKSNSWQGTPRGTTERTTNGWQQSCKCDQHKPVASIVLDPFGGAGTVGLVADRLGRHSFLFELNPEYGTIAENRLRKDGGMFIDIKTERPGLRKPRCRTS